MDNPKSGRIHNFWTKIQGHLYYDIAKSIALSLFATASAYLVQRIRHAPQQDFLGYVILAVLIFCAFMLAWIASRSTGRAALNSKSPDTPPPKTDAPMPAPFTLPPAPAVDLRGEILELYFHREEIPITSTVTVVMKVQIVNHGPVDATITAVRLQIRVGTDNLHADLPKVIPDSWRFRRRKNELFNFAYEDIPFDVRLGVVPHDEIYRKGVPRVGWLAFEFISMEHFEFPNAEFTLLLRDSLGGEHRIQRKPAFYKKTGEIIVLSA